MSLDNTIIWVFEGIKRKQTSSDPWLRSTSNWHKIIFFFFAMHVSVDCISCLSKDKISASSISLYERGKKVLLESNVFYTILPIQSISYLCRPTCTSQKWQASGNSSLSHLHIQHHLFHSRSNCGIKVPILCSFLAYLSTSSSAFFFFFLSFSSFIPHFFVFSLKTCRWHYIYTQC